MKLNRDDINVYTAVGSRSNHIFLNIDKMDILLSFENLEKLFRYLDTLNINDYDKIKNEIKMNYEKEVK